MSFSNRLMVELMIPRDDEVGRRLQGFYEEIGWGVRPDTEEAGYNYIYPEVGSGLSPILGYWMTKNLGKVALFVRHDLDVPSQYARGLRLPSLQELVEVCLVVPSGEDVHTIFDRGGTLLEAHAHVLPREHAGVQEFRFGDPFNYSLRVTADPGWQLEE